MTTLTGVIDNTVVSSSRAYLSSFINMPLLVKVIALEGTLAIISKIVTLTVQTLKSVRTECTSCSSLSRRDRLRIGLTTLSQQSMVLNSVKATTFLIFSALSTTDMCIVFSVPAIVILRNPRVYSSPYDYSIMTSNVK